LKFENVSLAKVVGDVQKALTDDIEKSHTRLTIGELHSVCAYEPTLNLMVNNLVANAIKFVKPGDAPAVTVRSEKHGEKVRLWVEDNGIGIHPDGLSKIFGVFQRLHPVDKYPGTGIGLAIVQKGAERMGGKAGVASDFGKGSRFWIELPEARSSSPANTP
jgi:signal transduction histidine kinase